MGRLCLLCNSRVEEELIVNIIFFRLGFIRTSLKTLTGRREIKLNLNLFHGLVFPLEMYISSFAGHDLTDRRLLIWVSLTPVPVLYTKVLNVCPSSNHASPCFPWSFAPGELRTTAAAAAQLYFKYFIFFASWFNYYRVGNKLKGIYAQSKNEVQDCAMQKA